MAVHTLGNQAAPTFGSNVDAAHDEIAPTGYLAMPANGYVSWVAAWFGANSGTGPARWILFDNGGHVLGYSNVATVGGLTWYGQNLITPVFRSAGQSVGGGWIFGGGTQHFGVYSGGNWKGGSVGGIPTDSTGFATPGSPFIQGGIGYYLQWLDPLSISSVSPNPAVAGQTVTLVGVGFTGGNITGVTVNGIGASFVPVDDGHMNVVIPNGFTTGNIVVTSDHGTASIGFTEGPPSISSISPSTAGVSQTVTLGGSGFTDGTVTSVTFNGVTATSYNVINNNTVTAVVPAGATTGPVVVSTNHGSASFALTVVTRRIWRAAAGPGWAFAQGSFTWRLGHWVQQTQNEYERAGSWTQPS
jgi:hypothetical protein